MELVPCNEASRQALVDTLFHVDEYGNIDKTKAEYVAKTFPSILLDITRLLTEQATNIAREDKDPVIIVRHQLKPYLMFSLLLGKCPQITGIMYSYYENSSFQPLPGDLFQFDTAEKRISYTHKAFTDELIKEILLNYFKYLAFNPNWFSAVWNWSELGRLITIHTNPDIRYLATCCLSVITKPDRLQHMSFLREIIGLNNYQQLIDLQIKHRHIYDNTFKPIIQTRREMADEFVKVMGESKTGYPYCTESIAKVANILLLKRDISAEEDSEQSLNKCQETINNYLAVPTLNDTISRVAYSLSINKPCLIRGPCGSGKTSIIDYIAAQTNRSNPPDYVKVQIGDQLDSKLLVGSYVCTEIPGQFEWQAGPLTKAMAYGSWIVFEDIDSAPSDMAQVIHSVIENGNLSCVSCCPIKLDSPHPDFRIFFTQRTRIGRVSDVSELGFGFVDRLCEIIDIPDLSDDDLKEIIKSRFKLGSLTPVILQLYKLAKTTMKDISVSRATRLITLKDLFKYCERLSNYSNILPTFDPQSTEKFSAKDLESVFMDAIDCFLSSLSKNDLKRAVLDLGQIVNISCNEVERLILQRKPDIREESQTFTVGRARLETRSDRFEVTLKQRNVLAYTRQSLKLMESISLCILHKEPVLLVGETGVGKTSIVQHIANLMRTKLIVMNLSQQSDSSDLLGGYSPVEMRDIMLPIYNGFEQLFQETYDIESNQTFLRHVSNCFAKAKKLSQWCTFLKLVSRLCTKALETKLSNRLLKNWNELNDKSRGLNKRLSFEKETSKMALTFSEGSLIRAVKEGDWILLDEINLAEPDVLQCLLLILDSLKKSQVYINSPNEGVIAVHPNFRIFACMNPSTDIGKRDLDLGTRGRFTEFFVDDVTENYELRLIVESYVKACLTKPQIESIVEFYREIRVRSHLYSDISGNSPVYSLRTLCRALSICSNNVCCNMEKSLYESLKITFLQQLNEASILQVIKLMELTVFNKKNTSGLEDSVVAKPKDGHQYVDVEGFWIQTSNEEPQIDRKYVITKSVKKNLRSLSRIVSLSQRKLPVLIQGETSVGKTSLIMYFAKITGNRCFRINNHEHTDLQEYVGRYVLREDGELVFQEGLLVKAMKKGYWIILDELNLAPSELLEALNRVLDDNRELFIPETRETIKAHAKFLLFATQNPPQEYAGRKLLSRAFRNRFIELHFDEIPRQELEEILQETCAMAPQHAKKIVAVLKELQMLRRESGFFNGKNGFMTLRDLFRWGQRYYSFKKEFTGETFYDWDHHIASEGLILLEGRVRTNNEANAIKSILEKVFKRKLDRDEIYDKTTFSPSTFAAEFKHIHFSREFKKLFVQLNQALRYREPVLLCGQTGCGKTTACQLYADIKGQKLITYNCHLNTESADFVGGVRPSRIEATHDSAAKQTFPWINGPLIEAMKSGSIFLMDEISLADDAVLERINSVLEPRCSMTLTEKDGTEIIAAESYRLVATMNPGGDYGKKELSPALRNRFTEIYCHNTTDLSQIRSLIGGCLAPNLVKHKFAHKIVQVMHQFLQDYYKNHDIISLRDIINWSQFLNKTLKTDQIRPFSIQEAIINGVSLVFFDQFGTCGYKSSSSHVDGQLKAKLRAKLRNIVFEKFGSAPVYPEILPKFFEINQDIVQFKKFYLYKGPLPIPNVGREFITEAPTVRKNMMKIVRAMQLDRPILLEGDPGAGKTSIITALAKLTGHGLVRINLSEQTDISDLFGSDLPLADESDDGTPSFGWHDGPMLRAIKESQWILLDEMNLASQSVLEGLNACFDHRGEIYISELNKTITVDRTSTKIFACQNPYTQGASRKGLPQSFLNRFTSIYVESHTTEDLSIIIHNLYSGLPDDLIEKMIEFNSQVSALHNNTGFEFNLRDLLYWCDLLTKYVKGDHFRELNLYKPDRTVQFVYLDRLRTSSDKEEICDLFEKIFNCPVYEPPYRDVRLGEQSFIMARAILPRKTRPPPHLSDLCILKYQMPFIESIAKAIESNKMPILVGESGSGKRSMMKIIAGLTGNDLNIVGANREMDTVELLGSFEQRSFDREIVDLVENAKSCVLSMINSISEKKHASTWKKFFNHMWITLYATSIRDLKLSKTEMMEAYRLQLSELKELIDKIEPLGGHEIVKRCQELSSRIQKLVKKSIYYAESVYSSGNFEWIDSILIKSIREGRWLMIENANLMNPATLDRLNSLVEPNGTLSLNEKGSGIDGIETLTPHPNFRLILTMNSAHGELSRAMRNRGVEIFVQTRFYFEDFLMLLNQNGFEPEEKRPCLTYCIMQTCYDVHKKITTEEPENGGSLLAYFGLNYTSTLTNHIRRGMDVDETLANLLKAYYTQRGYAEECRDDNVHKHVNDQMSQYRKTYEVNLLDERYKWRHLRHDLVSLTGGDAIPAMLDRDNRIFYDDFNLELLLKPEEMVENIDIINTCTTVKIFLELSTHGDFEYRKGFIRETFLNYQDMMDTVNKHVDLLHQEYIPFIKSLLPRSNLTLISDTHVDSRNSPDIHYYLQSLDYQGVLDMEGHQNRWIISLHRIMLSMVLALVEDRSMQIAGNISLWALSERVRTGEMNKEDLIRPCVEIVSDLHDLLEGILREISNRCFSNQLVVKMIPRLFWISFFLCKIKRSYSKFKLIEICNEIPMLWTLTYQKVLVPIIKDCDMADLNYKNKKFSYRIQHICDFLDITIAKPGRIEREFYYNMVLNMYASTTKQCEMVSREIDRFFGLLIGRYTTRSQALGADTSGQIASVNVWSNSVYMEIFYNLEDKLVPLELANQNSDFNFQAKADLEQDVYEEANKILLTKRDEYLAHEERLRDDKYRLKCSNVNRRKNALDQFAPIWQLKFIQTKLAKLLPDIADPEGYKVTLKNMLKSVNGIILSPRFYATLMKFFQRLQDRRAALETTFVSRDSPDLVKPVKEDIDMYTTNLVDYFIENVVLDHQIVGWTKLRVTTCDLPAQAPLIPEYSPIISLVAGYCLDMKHLKLNSYFNSTDQLDSLLIYLWRSYTSIKLDLDKDSQDLRLAQNLIHLRCKSDKRIDIIGSHQCNNLDSCRCVDEYITRRIPIYEELMVPLAPNVGGEELTYQGIMKTLTQKADVEDLGILSKGIKLIYFGYLNYLDYAPIFTLDPSIRTRQKLEVYRSELAHVKLELQVRNTLYYWKTGENLQLNEIDGDDALLYPFSTQIFVERRAKLERSINRLRREHNNRPKSDDGSLYNELRKDVEVHIDRYRNYIPTLMLELVRYVECKDQNKSAKLNCLVTKCRMLIKNLEKSISSFRSDYALYTDLLTNFLVGLCFVQQGLRCLYSRLEQKLQILEYGYRNSTLRFTCDLQRVFSFNNFIQGNMESVHNKLELFNRLEKICHQDDVSRLQSILLRTVLIQLNHHIAITPSDIEKCIPTVRQIADLFHACWLKRKLYLEDQRKQKEELFRYKTASTILGNEISFERQEFLDICSKFPTYDHIYQKFSSVPPLSADQENLDTEEKMMNLTRSVDLSMCIDIIKAHYKFIKEASQNLLGQIDLSNMQDGLPRIDISQLVELEAETLYTITRHCIPILDPNFDSHIIECHLLQSNQLCKLLRQTKTSNNQLGSLRNSIEILDEETFDIYHNSNAYEALRFQELIGKLNDKIIHLRNLPSRNYDGHISLHNMTKLITRISSFLISDPLMKFVTGSHALLEKLEEWNCSSIPKDDKFIQEQNDVIELIKSWRTLEIESWRGSLHRVKRKYIDSSLCDLWFTLYEAFNDPIKFAQDMIRNTFNGIENSLSSKEVEECLYQGFVLFIKNFLEEATLGDYQIRLDLVFSFAIQTRFASLYEKARPKNTTNLNGEEENLKIDYEKLTTYVYNTYRQFQGLMDPLKEYIEREEGSISKELNAEIRIVAWQGRNLWEIKNNFRVSHRKLNKVMNKYLELLGRPVPVGYIPPVEMVGFENKKMANITGAAKVSVILASTQTLIENVQSPTCGSINLKSLKKVSKIVTKMKEIYGKIYEPRNLRYVNNLESIEFTVASNSDLIQNFKSHKVQEVVINPKDGKEVRDEKLKLCRQMYHSKKYALQSIFKNLQTLGVSHQRGNNSHSVLDTNILSLEPLRGMIQNHSKLVLKAASQLVDDNLIMSCNDQYRKLIASEMILLVQQHREDITTDQVERINGCSLDMVSDIIKHNRSAAFIYRHLMEIQAATTRLNQLEEPRTETKTEESQKIVYNFSRIHKVIGQFNELVGRAYLALSKLEKLAECCQTAMKLENSDTLPDDGRGQIRKMISEIQDSGSMITRDQMEHIEMNLDPVRKDIVHVSQALRDMLNYTERNHLYSEDDRVQLTELHVKFVYALSHIIPVHDETTVNIKLGTILGSFKLLLEEAEQELIANILDAFRITEENVTSVGRHPNIRKLNIRMHKLIRQIMLAVQGVCKQETQNNLNTTEAINGAKRKVKDFNYIESDTIKKLLSLSLVTKHVGNCFITLNRSQNCTDITPIVIGLRPILFIYIQDVANYLNIILTSLHLKLQLANQLLPFFTDIKLNGFGLPYKVTPEEGKGTTKSKESEDNTGFGEGEGEVDVSKKLEFESQLDDLKNDSKEEEKKDENGKSVKAHDDGVEMSEDIDADAEGPEENKENGDDQDDQEENDEDQGEDELEKQLDTVDNDEGKLDEQLWGNEDEPVGEDDEEDLREAEDVPVNKEDPNKEPILASKDEKESKPESDAQADDKEPEIKEKEEQSQVAGDDEVVEALRDETLEALKADPPAEEPKETEPTDKQQPELIDLSVDMSDDEQVNEVDKVEEMPSKEADKSEGELSDGDEDDLVKEDIQEELGSQNTIDDSEIDQQLETALDPKETLPNTVEESIRHSSSGANEKGQQSGQQQMEGKKVGSHTLYDIFEEEENDPIDYDDINEQQEEPLGKDQEIPDIQDTEMATGDSYKEKTSKQNEESKADEKAIEDMEESSDDSKHKKRTLDQREKDDSLNVETKRQKILESKEDKKDDKVKKEEDNQANKSNRFKHIEEDKESAIPVIDLVSSDEEGQSEEPPEAANNDQPQLDIPKEASTSTKKYDESSELMSTDALIVDEDREESGDKSKENDDALSEISSIESGELVVDSGDENKTLDEVDRDLNTTYNTNLGLLKYISLAGQEADNKDNNLMSRIDNELTRRSVLEHDSVDADRLTSLWLDCTKRNGRLVQELCQQLQIVLQPTKMAKYKGDYKSGKRLNMRKIISYIASHYRKDKIWLRRTKPSKRTYNITLAVDNSSSMSENNCRQMTYQSLALLASSLSLIEAGTLSVVSFGEQVKCIHEFGQPYADAVGAQWLRELRFNESKTSYSQLLRHSCESFAKQAQISQSSLNMQGKTSMLLVIISDGRNVTSEEDEVKCYLRQLKSMGVLTLFVIIDDLKRNGGNSIVDVKRCLGLGSNVTMINYMELFPFPFYVLLRQLETMPSILGDALRQWFELVSNC